MSESEKGLENLVIVGRIENEHVGNDIETRLEGANAKIKILQKHMADQDEQLCQFIIVVRNIRVVLGSLPKDWHARVSVGFSPVKQVEEIEAILSGFNTDSPDWTPSSEE